MARATRRGWYTGGGTLLPGSPVRFFTCSLKGVSIAAGFTKVTLIG